MTLSELLPALPWLVPFLALARLARHRPSLTDFEPAPGHAVSIIIPARNEAANIETAVRSILASAHDAFELLVVDDRSTDETAAIIEGPTAEDARVTLVRGAPLPEGWYGKPWACVQGYRAARHDFSSLPTPIRGTRPSCSAGRLPRCAGSAPIW